ncbi:hypothetical protein LJC71_04765 [Desulfosarcina sp. OttesenSCG-928-A07]|nr:hypothetical protein [Desulfosarcina sp. OttesenSCG-928-G17]MDL2329049.1 hypothetical protein [Desulfosarcina sp. OttesenSCG-928-A07]
MKRRIKGNMKITEAGYLYINGEKVSERPITPLSVGEVARPHGPEVEMFAREWATENWRMCEIR